MSIPWLVVLLYAVPIIGTIAQIWRRMGEVWRIGESVRSLLPDDRFYRKIRGWDQRFVAWKRRLHLTEKPLLQVLNLLAGKVEYALGHLRDYTIGLFMMGAFVYDLALMTFWAGFQTVPFSTLFYHGFFALLTLWTYRRHVTIGLQMTEFMRINPLVHPQEFFDHYYRRLGPASIPIPVRATETVNPISVSYRTGKGPSLSLWTWIHGAYDTALFARGAFRALEIVGPEYGREIFDVMASLWGSRMLQLFRAELKVEGIEKIQNLTGKIILVFNHKSHLDFVFNFFALSSVRLPSGRRIRPRYLAAKDHLYDNKLVYSGFGIGKLIESCDMVFVDRKGKGRIAIGEALKKFSEREIDLALYPQGTRAPANYGPRGERLDAGYYTTGTDRLRRERGYLKKGCAHLAVDTAIHLRKEKARQPVHLVFIGIDGTATLIPKGAFKIQTEGTVQFTVGSVWTVQPEETEGVEKDSPKYLQIVSQIQQVIDEGLAGALRLHEKLSQRLLKTIKSLNLFSAEEVMSLQAGIQRAIREKNRTPFMILDRIYALPFSDQSVLLQRLSRQIFKNEGLDLLLEEVTELFLHHRQKDFKRIEIPPIQRVA